MDHLCLFVDTDLSLLFLLLSLDLDLDLILVTLFAAYIFNLLMLVLFLLNWSIKDLYCFLTCSIYFLYPTNSIA